MHRNVNARATSSAAQFALRGLGALLLLFVGADHYYEYSVNHYSVLPTIGTLFLLNFISATVIGLILLAPLNHISARHGGTVAKLAAFSGAGIAATSLTALFVSEQTKLFGFMESNYRPEIIIALASEAAAAAVLAVLFVVLQGSRRARPGSLAPLTR
jgi:hypothetical protein